MSKSQSFTNFERPHEAKTERHRLAQSADAATAKRGNVQSLSFLKSFNHFSFLYDAIHDDPSPYDRLQRSASYSPRHQSMVDDISLAEHQERVQVGGDSPISVTCLAFFKSFVATGILFIPQGYYNGGVIGSTVVNVFVGALATHCMALLLDCRNVLVSNSDVLMADKPPPRTYGDIASHVHPWGRTLVQCMIVGSQVGFCCVYLSLIRKLIDGTAEDNRDGSKNDDHRDQVGGTK